MPKLVSSVWKCCSEPSEMQVAPFAVKFNYYKYLNSPVRLLIFVENGIYSSQKWAVSVTN